MTGLPWFKCYPREFNEGMERLTLEERGAYVTLLNLIYAQGGPIADEAWWITNKLGCTKRTWVKLRAALIIKGKLFALNFNGEDCLMNERAAEEIEKQSETSRKLAEAGKKGGEISRPKPRKNNDSAQAGLQNGESQIEALQKSETDTEESPAEPSGSTAPQKAKRGSRFCPKGWGPSPETLTTLADEGFTPGDLERALTRMRDHEFRSPRSNWDMTFRNWVREDRNRRQPHERPHPDAKLDAKRANLSRAFAGADLAARQRFEP